MTKKSINKNQWLYWTNCLCAALAFLVSCSDSFLGIEDGTKGRINLSGNIRQENLTRANDYGFVDGDRMGIFIVDYDNGTSGSLSASGNRASNVLYTFSQEANIWTAPVEIYWRDNSTPVDVYGYYPGVNYIDDPSAYRFEVSSQQNELPREGEISNYEMSDLLWGKVEKVNPTIDNIVVSYRHQLAGVYVTLQKGEGITATEWEKLDKTVQIDNTIRTCNFNLQTSEITITGAPDRSIQMLPQSGDRYRAVVIPQPISAGKQLISVTIDGQSYGHQLSEPMKYQGGKMHNFTLTVNKNTATGEYTLAFTDGGITDWMNDETSHSFKQNQYVIINCPEPGKLKESIAAAGYDKDEMQNLKVTGKLNSDDVYFMRDDMRSLRHLNMADAVMRGCNVDGWGTLEDDVMPAGSFYGNKTIRSLVLPNGLKRIDGGAFREMELMNSTLIIPASVKQIDGDAFSYNDYNNVEMVLPEGLEILGGIHDCDWKCEFNLSDNITEWGGTDNCPNFYGTFHIPSKLKTMPTVLMGSNGSFDGDVEFPQGITSIPSFGVSMKKRMAIKLPAGVKRIVRMGNRYSSFEFNDDLEEISDGCFYNANMPFQIKLPSQLRKIGAHAFFYAYIEGELTIPENCLEIGSDAFSGTEVTKLILPTKMEAITDEAFLSMRSLREVTIPKYVRYIGNYAFSGDWSLQTVVCLAPEPPTTGANPFGPGGGEDNSVFYDKCVLEVPEQSVELYRNAPEWSKFKNITPHRELAFNVPSIKCMDKGTSREGIVRSQGPWEVAECPDWITVSPMSSDDRKTEVTITVKANSGDTREGKVVFKLKGYDYTTYTEVRQVNPGVKEEQQFTLQTASAGSRAIPIFIVGEGYDADDIASGKYLPEMKEQMEHIFSIEPMKSHRDRFTVSTAIACSPESDIYGMRKFVSNDWWKTESDIVLEYAQQYGVGIKGNESNAMIVVLRNTNNTGANGTTLYEHEHKGLSISWIGKSDDVYPFNQQGFVLREVVGTGFGKLGPEQVNHFTFMKACACPDCNMTGKFEHYRELGWWQNVSISGKLTELPWYHLIFDEKYSQMVDAWEGAMNHSRGAYRSENQSVMGNQFIPYFNAISREIIVKRIMEASGGKFDFNTFKANDKIEYPE